MGDILFVFYDTETTGTNAFFDQIVQFAAILTDDDLNPIDRIDVRCQLLPWIIPAPDALRVTGMTPGALTYPGLPSFYEMMATVHDKLSAWSPAVFVGYNTIKFDEPFLHRAFWQALLPPYLTVSNGNARMDVLTLAHATAALAPSVFNVPISAKGKRVYKLDQLAPANGFAHEHAHDALADVEATIHIARLIKDRAPELWTTAVDRCPKSETVEVLSASEPVMVIEYYGKPVIWWGQRIDSDGPGARTIRLADLGRDWSELYQLNDDELSKWGAKSPRPLRSLGSNKAPVVFTRDEASKYWGKQPEKRHLANSQSLSSDPAFRDRLARAHAAGEPQWEPPEELEERIYEDFPGPSDTRLMQAFHREDWSKRSLMISQFEDIRLQSLARRWIYVGAPDLLSDADRQAVEQAIATRLHSDQNNPKKWRTIAQTKTDLCKMMKRHPENRLEDPINIYLDQLAARYAPTLSD